MNEQARILIEEREASPTPLPEGAGERVPPYRGSVPGSGDGGSHEPPSEPPVNPSPEPEEDHYSKMSSQILFVINEQMSGKLTRQGIEDRWYSLRSDEEPLRQNLAGLRRAILKRDHRIPKLIREKSYVEKITPDFAFESTKFIFTSMVASNMEPDEIFEKLKVARTERFELEPKRLIEGALRGQIYLP